MLVRYAIIYVRLLSPFCLTNLCTLHELRCCLRQFDLGCDRFDSVFWRESRVLILKGVAFLLTVGGNGRIWFNFEAVWVNFDGLVCGFVVCGFVTGSSNLIAILRFL